MHNLPCRTEVIVQYLLDWLPNTKVVLLGLLPRGKSSHIQPSIFTAATNDANQRLRSVPAPGPPALYMRTGLDC